MASHCQERETGDRRLPAEDMEDVEVMEGMYGIRFGILE